MGTEGCVPAFILFSLSCSGFAMLFLIRMRLGKKYACLAEIRNIFCEGALSKCPALQVSGFAGVHVERGVGEKMWALPTR